MADLSTAIQGVLGGFFQSGPDDSLLTVDPSGVTPQETLSKIKTTTGDASSSLLDKAKAGFSTSDLNLKDLSRMVKIGENGVGLNTSEALRVFDRSLGTSIGGIESVSAKVKSDAISSALKLAGFPGVGELVNKAGQTYSVWDTARTDNAMGVFKALARLTGNDALGGVVSDIAKDSAFGALLTEALELGVPDAIDEIMNQVKDKELAKQRLIASLQSIVLRCDLASLRKVIEYIGAEAVIAKMPDAVMFLLAGYRFPPRTKPADYAALKAYLVETLGLVQPTWTLTKRNGVDVPALAPFSRISRDASIVLLSHTTPALNGLDPEYLVPVLCAKSYTLQDIQILGKKFYPQLVQWGLTR
jgi:hypothetical protein